MPFSARVGFFKLIEAIADFPVWPIVPTQEQMNTELQTNFVSSANATLTYSDFGIIGSGGAKRRHGVAHPNGNIYILPRNNSQMLIYDTSSNVMTTKTLFTDYQGGALSGYNGNIYMMPQELAAGMFASPVISLLFSLVGSNSNTVCLLLLSCGIM